MSSVISMGVALVGFLAGMLLCTQITRWVGLLYVSGSKEGGDFLGPPKRRLLWAIPFVALLHPTPWLVGLVVFLGFRAFRGMLDPGWLWFFGGLIIAVLFMAVMMVTLIARSHSSASRQRSRSDKSVEQTRDT